jgi:small-conductance mechanosensitive channel
MGVNVRAVLTFSGVGGVLLGLAGREMLANFIGGER